ncbi:alpha/beta hydrolase [Flavihumibacter sediminis]|nr:alpha/beta hydrolase [Flavihumibacter sediminis]
MMHYTITGEGQPLMLIHGFGEDSRIWEKQIAALKDNYQLIIPELPGTGQSPMQSSLTMESMADEILEILEKEKIESIVMLGHSMGGYITLAFAEKYPERLRGFGLLHSTGFADPEAKKEARTKSINFIRENGSAAFLQTATANLFAPANRESMVKTIDKIINDNTYILPESLAAFLEAMKARPDRTEILKKATIPVLFIVGKEDQAVPFADTMQQVHLPELSYIYILQHSGHMGMLEETEKFTAAIQKFMNDLHMGGHNRI